MCEKRPFLIAAAIVIVATFSDYAGAGATITVVNLDTSGEGFNDPTPAAPTGGNAGVTLGQQRLIAFQHAATLLGAQLDSDVEIFVGASFDPLPCDAGSAVLGSAGAVTAHRDFAGAPVAATWYAAALANKLAGTDLNPGVNDIGATFNSTLGTTCAFPAAWYLGLDANPPGNDIDLVTVVLHELVHGVGFQSFVSLATGAKLLGFDDAYTLNLEDHSTGLTYPQMLDAERLVASIDTGDLHWLGAAVVAASGGLISGVHASGHVEMYAPNPQEPGSSVSHFSTSLSPDELMEPFLTAANHSTGLARQLLADLGWGAPVRCDIALDQASYTAGDTVTATTFRLANPGSDPVSVEWKVWLGIPTIPPISVVNLGADGLFTLPPGFDLDFAPLVLFPAAGLPLGAYEFSCRLLDPVTGVLMAEDLNPFTIQ